MPNPRRILVPLLLAALLLPAAALGVDNPAVFSRLRDLPVNDARRSGAKAGDQALDNIPKINAASAAAVAGGGTGVCFLPPGTFYVAPSGDNANTIVIRSNLTIRGSGPSTVIKVKDNNGNYGSLFYSNATVTNFTLEDLTIDQNAAGNITGCDAGVFTGRYQVAVLLNGTNTADVNIRRVNFDTCTGVNTVAPNALGCKRVNIENCYFHWKKAATSVTPGYDNSVCYMGCAESKVIGNRFYSDNYADCPGGAVEIHGPHALVANNLIDGFTVGSWIVSTFFLADQLDSSDISFTNNVISRGACGVGVISGTSVNNASPVLNNVAVTNNVISLLQAGTHHDAQATFGVDVRPGTGAVLDGLTIERNRITFEADTRATSARWGSLANSVGAGVRLNGPVSNVSVADNWIVRAPWSGFVCANIGTATIDRTSVRRNHFIDCGWNDNGVFNSVAEITGVWTDGAIEDNEAVDTATGATPNGTKAFRIYLTSAATRTTYANNTVQMAGSGSLTTLYSNAGSLISSAWRGSEDVAYASSYTPDPTRGATKLVAALTGTFNVQAPTVSLKGMLLEFVMPQDGTGTRAMNFNAVFKKNWTPDTTAGKTNVIVFRCDGTNWNQVGATTGL